ncbi:MAG: hypothetical protein Q8P44_05170, partial [Dehalococcoidia bacterium]|nr:hypothetical protein [Dehalococcoidia bacterium]
GVAARTDDQAPYMIGDYLLNLQDNKFDNYNKEFKEWVPLEEWQFAALLWDVMDQDRQPEPGDQVAWGLSRLWGVLSNVSSWTVRGHYEALKAEAGEPLPGPQDSPTALDRLFILHGFYSNTNGVAGWQQGEPIGYPDSWKPRAAPSASWGPAQHPAGVRFSPAVPQYLWLEPELPAKVPPPNIAELTVYPTDGRSPWKAPLRAAPDGRFPLLVPPGAERIQLRLLVPGFQVAPLEFTRSNYKAVIEKGTVVVRAKPEVQPSPVGSPGNFNLRREEASTVTLTWSPAKGVDHVVVVRGASHTPASPGDGTVVYEGTGSSVTDDGAILAGTTYYAAFSIGQDGGISVPAIVTSAAPAPQAGSSSSQATKGSSPQTTLPSVPPAGQPRGKAPSSGTSGVNWYLIAGGITFVWLIVLLVRRKLKKG